MELGLFVNPLHERNNTRPREKFDEVVRRIELAEEWGYRSVWLTEHHFLRYSRPSTTVTLASVARTTSTIRLGFGVAVLPFHHPVRLAEDIATLDQLSHGRVDVGIGRGLFPREFSGFSMSMEESRARFEEALELLRLAWMSDEPFSFHGAYHQVEDVVVYPRPYQDPHPPIFQALVSPGSFETAVSRGIHGLVGPYLTPFEANKRDAFDPWNAAKETFGAPHLRNAHNEIVYVAESREEAYRDAREPVMEYVRAAGEIWGSPDDAGWTTEFSDRWGAMVSFFRTVEWDEVFENLIIAGDPDYVAARFAEYEAAGVDEMLVYPCDLDFDKTSRSLELLTKEVMPRLRRQSTDAVAV
jgi:alkanesulfonate monooxygenase SsuD/methylene tetrahydromethanopterin reductase-like flavin-dependent oxidoreductase (luciferase family)